MPERHISPVIAPSIGAVYERAREIERQAGTLRAPGHRLSMDWSGERGAESSSTGTCTCGWQESGSSQRVVRSEYRHHLAVVIARRSISEVTETS